MVFRLVASAALSAVASWSYGQVLVLAEEASEDSATTCRASGCKAAEPGSSQYYWPRSRGHVGAYSTSSYTVPWNLTTALKWKWNHPLGQYRTITVGVVIDDEKNIYLTSEWAVYKLNEYGSQMWEYQTKSAELYHNPTLMDGRLFDVLVDGNVFALNMSTGEEIWRHRCAESKSWDTGYVEAYNNRVVASVSQAWSGGGDKLLVGLDPATGEKYWEFQLSGAPVWNFMAHFPGDDTFLFMDLSGGMFRLNLTTGVELWHTPSPFPLSYTDGGMILSPDGKSAFGCFDQQAGELGSKGVLQAHDVESGKVLWLKDLSLPCTSWPAISSDGSFGVVPISAFLGAPWVSLLQPPVKLLYEMLPMSARGAVWAWSNRLGSGVQYLPSFLGFPRVQDTPSEVLGFDPKTGNTLWRYVAEPFGRSAPMGDDEGLSQRVFNSRRVTCLPAMWASPTIDGNGATYVGRSDGYLYALKDTNGDGFVDGPDEVSRFWTGAGALHPGSAFAPGMMAAATCDTLFVFKTDT